MLGALLGKGNTADVFATDNNRAVKLFHAGYSKSSVTREFKNSQLLNQLNLPIAQSYKMILSGDRYGIVYDKIDGTSLLELIFQTHDIEKYALLLASMHKKILCKNLPEVISFKAILQKNIENTDAVSAKSKAKVLEILHKLPDSDGLCHGDFHFGNILMEQQDIHIIDFMNICKGHKNFDIARTVYLTEMTPVPKNMPNKEQAIELKKRATDIYLKEMGIRREDLTNCLTVIVAARLSELRSDQIVEKESVMQYLSLQGL